MTYRICNALECHRAEEMVKMEGMESASIWNRQGTREVLR